MSFPIPLLLNHDLTKPVGFIGRDGVGTFNEDQRVTREMLFDMLGGAGVNIIKSFVDEQGTYYVRAFELIEFSICGEFTVGCDGVVRDFKPFAKREQSA